jgi:hypothetical protein
MLRPYQAMAAAVEASTTARGVVETRSGTSVCARPFARLGFGLDNHIRAHRADIFSDLRELIDVAFNQVAQRSRIALTINACSEDSPSAKM